MSDDQNDNGRQCDGERCERRSWSPTTRRHILHVVSLKLRNAGFRVLTARDGQEALEMAQQEQPDLLITDYHMPQLSGLELCQQAEAGPGDAATSPRSC